MLWPPGFSRGAFVSRLTACPGTEVLCWLGGLFVLRVFWGGVNGFYQFPFPDGGRGD